MKPIISAFQFLTIIPLRINTGENDIGRSTPWFPLAGFLVGACGALAWWCAERLHLPQTLSSALALTALAAVSGGLHLDGLADSADGLLSHRPPDRILEIMKDSCIGSMGVLAIFFVLLLKWTSLTAVPTVKILPLLLVACTASRASMSLCLTLFPYARNEGLALVFMKHRKTADAAVALAIAFATAWFCLRMQGVIICASCLVSGILFSAYCRLRIKGITGDTLGAVSEIGEMVSFLAAAIIFSI